MAATSTSYTREALKLIGEECRTRLPAASLVQAMFMVGTTKSAGQCLFSVWRIPY